MDNRIQLHNGDCLEFMKTLEDNSIDLILTDPPYGTVNGLKLDGWKNRDDILWDNIINIEEMYEQCNRILRSGGCLILFSQEPFTSQLITRSIPDMPFSYRSIWLKDHFANALYSKKAPLNFYEDINVFFKSSYDTSFKHPLRDYSKSIMNYCNLKLKDFNEIFGRKIEHFFYINSIQFSLPTEKTYKELTEYFNLELMNGYLSYDEIKEINSKYEKVFNLSDGKKYKSNVYQYKKPYEGLHPTQKPVDLLEDLIKTYSNENDIVLDFTMGSGSTAIACLNTNRNFIGCELDENYFNIAKDRINKHQEKRND